MGFEEGIYTLRVQVPKHEAYIPQTIVTIPNRETIYTAYLNHITPKSKSTTSTPQLPFKRPQISSNRDHKALNRGTLEIAGSAFGVGSDMV